MSSHSNRFLAAFAVATATLFAGCPDEQVTHETVAKAPAAAPAAAPTAPMAGAPMGADPHAGIPGAPPLGAGAAAAAPGGMPGMPGMAGNVPPPPTPTGASKLAWTLPTGWTEAHPGGMRYATLNTGAANVDASVVVLGGMAGGEAPNVNRWRGQLGLPPLDPTALPSARTSIDSKVGPVSLYDFSTDGAKKTRLVAGLIVVNDSSWFFKMIGDADAVGTVLPGFKQMLQSLRPGTSAN